jgi:hypothetical protein
MSMFRRNVWRLGILAALIALPVALVSVSPSPSRAAANPEESKKWFVKMSTVMLYFRCINCHTTEDFPAQGDDHHKHANDVIRSASQRGTGSTGFGAGAGAVPCLSCHSNSNQADGRQPGAFGWRMPPASMGWDKMKSAGELCRHVVDPNFNGGRDAKALVEHMRTDPLVQYAFDPGAHTKPPLTQAEFHEAVEKWAETGAACPDD